MSKAIVVKTNKQTDVSPYSDSNPKPIYQIVKAKLPKGKYVISAKATFYVKNWNYADRFEPLFGISLECNGQNDNSSFRLYPPIIDRITIPLNMAISLENDAEVSLKARCHYRTITVLDAQISAISVDELNISTGHNWEFGDVNGINFRPFSEESGNPFIQDDMMKLEDNRWLIELSKSKRSWSWIGRLIEGIDWLTRK